MNSELHQNIIFIIVFKSFCFVEYVVNGIKFVTRSFETIFLYLIFWLALCGIICALPTTTVFS